MAGEGLVGLSRFELLTPRLSSVCSNQLSYRPIVCSTCWNAARALRLKPGASCSQTVKEPDFVFRRAGRSATCRPRREAPRPVLSKLDRRARLNVPSSPPERRRCVSADNPKERPRPFLWIVRDRSWRLPLKVRRHAVPRNRHSRKEVIQPQVLLQLPCYDFTPITDHTLGAYLPCGLARRLLVQPAFVM